MGGAHSARFCAKVVIYSFVSQILCINQIDLSLLVSGMSLLSYPFRQQWVFGGGAEIPEGTSRTAQPVLGTTEFCFSHPKPEKNRGVGVSSSLLFSTSSVPEMILGPLAPWFSDSPSWRSGGGKDDFQGHYNCILCFLGPFPHIADARLRLQGNQRDRPRGLGKLGSLVREGLLSVLSITGATSYMWLLKFFII